MKPQENNLSRNPAAIITQIFNSFKYAFSGLTYSLLTQRNMRFHFFAALLVMSLAVGLKLSSMQKAFLFIVISFVFSMEVLNTCIESFTDMISPNFNKLAKAGKDTAAAAVLVVSIGSVMSAAYLLLPPVLAALYKPKFYLVYLNEIIAFGTIISAVFLFWFLGRIQFLELPLLISLSAISAYAVAYLCYSGKDIISLFAILFFSFLLLCSMGKRSPALYVFIGQILGLVFFGIKTYSALF